MVDCLLIRPCSWPIWSDGASFAANPKGGFRAAAPWPAGLREDLPSPPRLAAAFPGESAYRLCLTNFISGCHQRLTKTALNVPPTQPNAVAPTGARCPPPAPPRAHHPRAPRQTTPLRPADRPGPRPAPRPFSPDWGTIPPFPGALRRPADFFSQPPCPSAQTGCFVCFLANKVSSLCPETRQA